MGLLDFELPEPNHKPVLSLTKEQLEKIQNVDAINRRQTYKEIAYKERRCDKKIKYKKTRLH